MSAPTLESMLAQAVVLRGEEAMRRVLSWYMETDSTPTPEERAAAIDEHEDDECSIDERDLACISRGEDGNGYWISATVWTYYPACDKCEENHRPGTKCNPDALATAIAQNRSEL